MNARTKIFIADYDCAKQISLMLWLEQFTDLEIAGAAQVGPNFIDKINEMQPDVVLLNVHPDLVESLHVVRAIRSTKLHPSILATSSGDTSVGESLVANEADEVVNTSSSIKELCESIRRLANRRRVGIAASNRPLTKVG